MSLPIVHYNEPVLRSKGEQVVAFDSTLARLAGEMIATMHAAGGIGLAAQQVGRALQLCVVDLRDAESEFNWEFNGARPPLELFMPLVLVNPQMTITPGTPETTFEEGCLSFPNIRGNVARRDALTVRFQDPHGLPHVLTCDGLLARCIQHEVDHLQGVLFIQRMDAKTRSDVDEAVKALAKETRAGKKKAAAS